MKLPALLLVAAAFATFGAANCPAGELTVIANSSVKPDTISAAELKSVFLEEKISLADGTHVIPVLEKDGPVNASFLRVYLGMSEDDLQTYYRTLLFTGKGSIPKAFASDAETIRYVARTRGAIGYVGSAAFTAPGVKALSVGNGINRGSERKLMVRVEPEYPETLKRLNIGGTVRFRISIAASGNVDQVELLGGNPILAESAMVAVRKWLYAAGRARTETDITLSFGDH